MEILNMILALLMTAAIVAIFWAIPIILGVKWAKRNKVSPHWMWFGIYPLGGWIAFAVIRWGGRIDKVGNVAVKWITGKVACSSCDAFHSMKTGFCATCGRALPKPLCPRCKEAKTQLVNVKGTGSFISPWISLLLGCAVFALIVVAEGPGVDGMYDTEELGTALVAAIICVYAVIFVVKRFSLRAKRIKCLSCGRESPVTDVVSFHQPLSQEAQPEPLTPA